MHTIYTIGTSTRSIEQFLDLLRAHNIEELVDVRTIPKSRHNPQFGQEELAASLKQAGIDYVHLGKLGGLRHSRKDSVNLGWQNLSVRGSAYDMSTPEFQEGLDELKAIAGKKRVAIMCSEAVPWRSHRSLTSQALTTQGWQVLHIQSRKTTSPHNLTPFLKLQYGNLTYPPT